MLFLSLGGTMKYLDTQHPTKTSTFLLFARYRDFTAFKQYTIMFYGFHVHTQV